MIGWRQAGEWKKGRRDRGMEQERGEKEKKEEGRKKKESGRGEEGREGGREGEKKVREEEKGREVLLKWKVRKED